MNGVSGIPECTFRGQKTSVHLGLKNILEFWLID